jgi:serine/threonine protein kinase
MSQQLTEKSDVFSFGIVLLEIICGRQPINTALQDRNQWNIGEWVSQFFIFQDKNHKHFF